MKPLRDLINRDEPGWDLVASLLEEATNDVQVLPCTPADGEHALYEAQVTSRSPMGAVALQTGGILVDHGWIRILGAGCERLPRALASWNLGKSIDRLGDAAPYWIVADDVVGGIFAINGGEFGDDLGKLYYFAQDCLEWEPMEISYTDFLLWCFSGDLEGYYEDCRWTGWQADVAALPGDKTIGFYPFLCTDAPSLEARSRAPIPADESYSISMDMAEQFAED